MVYAGAMVLAGAGLISAADVAEQLETAVRRILPVPTCHLVTHATRASGHTSGRSSIFCRSLGLTRLRAGRCGPTQLDIGQEQFGGDTGAGIDGRGGEPGTSSAKGQRMKRLTGSDAMMLYSEAANVPMHTVKVAILNAPDASDFSVETALKVVQQRLHRFEPLRRALVETPYGFHRPMWRENCPVDLAYHVRQLHLPAPGGRRELDDAIAKLIEEPLDRTRPLWEIYVVDGLADGRLAVVTKIHHALADGVASANLLAAALDKPEGGAGAECDPHPSRAQLLWTAIRDHVRQVAELPSLLRYTAASVHRLTRSRRNRAASQSPTILHESSAYH